MRACVCVRACTHVQVKTGCLNNSLNINGFEFGIVFSAVVEVHCPVHIMERKLTRAHDCVSPFPRTCELCGQHFILCLFCRCNTELGDAEMEVTIVRGISFNLPSGKQ